MPFNLSPTHAKYLVSNYGRNTDKIIDEMQSFNDPAEIALARAEAWYCINFELAGENSDGFSNTVFPAAMALTNGIRLRLKGKFQGERMRTTPLDS